MDLNRVPGDVVHILCQGMSM